jgi:hypothetical protein
MPCKELLTESEILKDEILSRTESTHGPSQEMTKRGDDDQDHGPNLTETRGVRSVYSFILRLHEVLTRDSRGGNYDSDCLFGLVVLCSAGINN